MLQSDYKRVTRTLKEPSPIIFLLLIFAIHSVSFASERNESDYIRLSVNGYVINGFTAYDAPEMVDSRVLVPTRLFFESIGAEVQWLGETKKALVLYGDTTIELTVDQSTALVNGRVVDIGAVPKLLPDSGGRLRTLLPLRFISESLGAQVEWQPEKAMVTVRSSAFDKAISAIKLRQEGKVAWHSVLVNRWNPLEMPYSVKLKTFSGNYKVDERIHAPLTEMLSAARAEGLAPMVCSAYRSVDKQRQLFDQRVSNYMASGYSKAKAIQETSKWVAIPGTSEHHTGLAVDIISSHYTQLNEGQEETAEQKWLMANAHRFGFILRYPKNKTAITGINYEPWHYRYVGKELAKSLFEKGITLEEYWGTLK